MKLDYETLQFERQLKRAKRLSLLDYAANEERRKQDGEVLDESKQFSRSRSSASVSKKRTSHSGRLGSQPEKIRRCATNTISKLRRSAVRRVVGRQKIGPNAPKVKRGSGVVRQSPVKQNHTSYAESHQLLDLESCSQLSQVDIEARLEIVASATLSGKHSLTHDTVTCEGSLNGIPRERKLPQPSFRLVDGYIAPPCLGQRSDGYYRFIEKTSDELDDEVEYDMDEEVFHSVYFLGNECVRCSYYYDKFVQYMIYWLLMIYWKEYIISLTKFLSL
jgi:Enhancer of polycomb-like